MAGGKGGGIITMKTINNQEMNRIPLHYDEIILCPKCKGEGTKSHWTESVEFTGWKELPCPECEKKGRLRKFTKIEFQLVL
jgi:hypothetical protein